jgi:integrase
VAYLVARGSFYWFRVKENGRWKGYRTDCRTSDPNGERNAQRIADRAQAKIDRRAASGAPAGPITLRAFAARWVVERRKADLDWKNDDSRLKHHVLPDIGDMRITDVRPKQLADLVSRWRHDKKLAQRTVYNVFSTVRAMFRDAAVQGEIEQNPSREIGEAQLGPLVDSDPKWRSQAVFTRDEAETLISDERIPPDRRLYYAFMLLAGMRPGEIAVLRWSDFDGSVEPLGRIVVAEALNTRKGTIKGTKTNAVRDVPVHPTLAAMLAEWSLAGEHEAGDLILPLPADAVEARRTRKGEPLRTGDYAGKKWREVDLKMLGWRGREMYSMKSTFISLCGVDGCKRDSIKRITHARTKRDAFDGYDRASYWPEDCREIAKLKLARKKIGAAVVAFVRK